MMKKKKHPNDEMPEQNLHQNNEIESDEARLARFKSRIEMIKSELDKMEPDDSIFLATRKKEADMGKAHRWADSEKLAELLHASVVSKPDIHLAFIKVNADWQMNQVQERAWEDNMRSLMASLPISDSPLHPPMFDPNDVHTTAEEIKAEDIGYNPDDLTKNEGSQPGEAPETPEDKGE